MRNQITLTLQDEDGLVNRNLAMRWGQIGLTVKSGIVRLAFLEDIGLDLFDRQLFVSLPMPADGTEQQ